MAEDAGGVLNPPTTDTVEQLSRVAMVASALTAGLDAADVVEIVVRQGMASLGAEGGVLAFVQEGDFVVPAVTAGYPPDVLASFAPLRLSDEYPLTAAARDGAAVWVSSRLEAESRFPELVAKSTTSQAWAAIPLVVEGVPFGVLGVSFLAPRPFDPPERFFMSTLADLATLALRAAHGSTAVSADAELTARVSTSPAARLDRALDGVFRASLTMAVALDRQRVDAEVAAALHRAVGDLDVTAVEIQQCSFELRSTSGGPPPR